MNSLTPLQMHLIGFCLFVWFEFLKGIKILNFGSGQKISSVFSHRHAGPPNDGDNGLFSPRRKDFPFEFQHSVNLSVVWLATPSRSEFWGCFELWGISDEDSETALGIHPSAPFRRRPSVRSLQFVNNIQYSAPLEGCPVVSNQNIRHILNRNMPTCHIYTANNNLKVCLRVW